MKYDRKLYNRLKYSNNYSSVGLINKQYVYEILTGVCDVPEYYPITREEFDTFEDWEDDEIFVVNTIKNRTLLAGGWRKTRHSPWMKSKYNNRKLGIDAGDYKIKCSHYNYLEYYEGNMRMKIAIYYREPIVYLDINSEYKWTPPDENVGIDEGKRKQIFKNIYNSLSANGLSVVVMDMEKGSSYKNLTF